MELTYANVVARLLDAVPALRAGYRDEEAFWAPDPPGSHAVFSGLLVPHLTQLLATSGNESELGRTFDLLEEMVISPQAPVQEIAVLSVLEGLAEDRKTAGAALPWLKPESRREFLDIIQRIEENVGHSWL